MKAQVAVVEVHASGSVSGDETVAVETDMVGVDFFTVGLPEDIEEVLVRAAYDIGIFEVFEQCRGEVYRFMGVRLAEIRVRSRGSPCAGVHSREIPPSVP